MRPSEQGRRRSRRWVIAGIGAVVLGSAATGITYSPLFAAREIRLEGTGAIGRATILRIAGVDRDANVFHLDARAVERRLRADPRILDARVTRALPDGLTIRVVRRVPVASVGIPAAFVGADGVVIGPAAPARDLPSLTTEDGAPLEGSARTLAAGAAGAMSPELRRSVDTVVVDGNGGLEVRLEVGFSAYLGDGSELAEKAASLAALLEWVIEEGVTVVSADLTVPGSPTAQLKSEGTPVPVP